jgi:hypothetical protein
MCHRFDEDVSQMQNGASLLAPAELGGNKTEITVTKFSQRAVGGNLGIPG